MFPASSRFHFSTIPSTKPTRNTAYTLYLDYPEGDCAPLAFEYQASGNPDMTAPFYNIFRGDESGVGITPFSNEGPLQTVDPDQCYYWRARALASDGSGPWTEIQLISSDNGCEQVATATSAEALTPYAVATRDTNCRASDYNDSANIGTIKEGQQALILAVNPQGTYVRVEEPNFQVHCWVWVDLVDLKLGTETIYPDDLIGLVSIQQAPAPTSTPTSTSSGGGSGGGASTPQCSDGVDNDGDGKADYYAGAVPPAGVGDAQCSSPTDNDESS